MENLFVNDIMNAGLDAIAEIIEELGENPFPTDDSYSDKQFIENIASITDEELAKYDRERHHFSQKIA